MNGYLQHAMPDAITHLTPPIVWEDSSLHFSGYGNQWGYAAFKLPADVICEKLGAQAPTPDQLLAAFENNKERIAFAIAQRELPAGGQRIQLDASDF